ncbi:MAG: glycoside hydrolase family 127 protein [Bacteroidaceae bacterium]|nr:glycoside hydrolase family 127 protein [Bacteroidaceae bacterium]
MLKNKLLLFTLAYCGALCPLGAASMPKPKGKAEKKWRTIASIQPVHVDCPQGNAPLLPFQVWVTYSDGNHEWRQVRWTNTSTSTERSQADFAIGRQYTVQGFVTGDNTTEQGYPVVAHVNVVSTPASPSPLPVAHPLPLADVRLTGENRLTHNRKLDVEALLRIDYRQMLYNYRDTYGLPTEGYPVADGWDSPTTKLKGHGTGHYLSALAFAYATETDEDGNHKSQLLSTIRHMVNAMRECQERTFVYDESLGRYREARDYAPEEELLAMKGKWTDFDQYKKDYTHYGYGYMNAIPAAHPALIECYRAYNNEDWVWAPYYTIHKQLAGLIDIALNVDDKEVADKALLIAKDMGLWVWNRLHYRTFVQSEGTQQERRSRPGNRYEMWNMYIAGEVGGMQESLARLSTLTGDATERQHLLEASTYFDSPAFFQPLSRHIDDVRTRHANQHIPMITGALHTFQAGGDAYYYNVAHHFWHMLQGRYVYAMGGVGNGEMFRQPYSQMMAMNTNVMSWNHKTHPNPDLNETCCAYNLAKLTKDLNAYHPDDARYMDYYERVLMNQIVGSLNPEHYACTYQYAVGLNARKPFGNETPQSSCCGGTGAENHVKYQEATYYANDSTMWITQYMPTEAYWREKDVFISQSCTWPASDVTIRVRHKDANKKSRFSLKLRIPYWATAYKYISLNDEVIARNRWADDKVSKHKKLPDELMPCSYYEIPEREWSDDDKVTIHLSYSPHLDFGPDKMDVAATDDNPLASFSPSWLATVMYGPLVMATPDVHTWQEADFNVLPDLSNLSLNYAHDEKDGTGGPLYSLSLYDYTGVSTLYDQPAPHTIILQPDYYITQPSTHYLRLNVLGRATTSEKEQLSLNRQMLDVALETAEQRHGEQQTWLQMTVKVPEHSPWAPHGYARFLEQWQHAQAVSANRAASAREVMQAASSLNVALNSMRPGNLAEPEDLHELLPLLDEANRRTEKSDTLRDAIQYARMVVSYVNDGSGTRDMIQKAVELLKPAGR